MTQLPIPAEDHIYFGDIALPDLKVLIEPDGRTKFGDNEGEVRENTGKWLTCQHDLTNAGWRVIRVRWHDTEDLVAFRASVATRLGNPCLLAQESPSMGLPRPPSAAGIHRPKHINSAWRPVCTIPLASEQPRFALALPYECVSWLL